MLWLNELMRDAYIAGVRDGVVYSVLAAIVAYLIWRAKRDQ